MQGFNVIADRLDAIRIGTAKKSPGRPHSQPQNSSPMNTAARVHFSVRLISHGVIAYASIHATAAAIPTASAAIVTV